MIKIGIIALARQINGGTLPYTFSMIDALAELPKSNYSVTIFTQKNNDEFDGYNFPKQSIKSTTNLFFSRLLGLKTGFEEMDVVLAPVYSIRLLLIKKPFIFTLHDLQERYFPENFPFAVRVWRKLINA